MRTAVWLYLFLFVAFFDLHAQYPILSPFALSLGAAPSFIGLILGVYSITHLPGNILAGYGVDRYGSKPFIVSSLIVAGIILLFQSNVTDPWELLLIRSVSGFVLAFLSPSCMALLAKMAKDHIQQGKLMAVNGLVHTLASVLSPAAGALLVAKVGFTASFTILGWILIITGFLSIVGVKEEKTSPAVPFMKQEARARPIKKDRLQIPWMFYIIPLAVSCSQGILFFELPMMKTSQSSILTSGIFFSLVSLGALCTLSLLFLNRIPSLYRTMFGSLALALVFFIMAVDTPIPLTVSLFMLGMAKGIIFPALSTLLAAISSKQHYGKAFSFLSVSFSIGAFFGPLLAGHFRETVSPYFIAFFILMLALLFLPVRSFKAASAL
ncbi:MFS transporter [Paenibacillus larvae]|uniref:Exporter-like protein n=4 Tax=Paenibacillus larvae TaxID=1464 RepID=V9WAB0_9BACL|nr:MFS transporter [Paenibacillus larvae]AHD06784.1 exporter-like protein [Paenibacillus larvae subsp. larvae DSM 25430]AQR77830.1 MFS transporter [Paenibacillus larvae subsp. larvae]AQT84265.1 MFS transporter [Paenibacillus larvae subsp. pulvifaciens]AQZ46242.1 MFS transporter [Paenibacillus larvae subsp. pulvifaciens]ARF67572.1 MFS transporter [Paenibacillus larvae subsp. pulvifaciens]